jgi:hypothetical protein
MFKTILVIFLSAFIGIEGHSQGEKTTLSAEEYAVYSSYLNAIEKSPEDGKAVKLIVINNQTHLVYPSCSPDAIARYDKRIANDEYKPLFKDLQAKSTESNSLKNSFNIKHKYVFLDVKRFAAFFKSEDIDGWQEYYKAYPNSPGYISLSRVGFNADQTKALMFRSMNCGTLCASGDYLFFEKKNGQWKQVSVFNCWMS